MIENSMLATTMLDLVIVILSWFLLIMIAFWLFFYPNKIDISIFGYVKQRMGVFELSMRNYLIVW